MHKAMLKLVLALFILGVINPGVSNVTASGAGLNDYYQSSFNKQSQVLPLVKNVHVKIVIAGPDYCFTTPLWVAGVQGNTAVNGSYTALPKRSQNIHFQQYLKLLLYPPHFFS